MSDIPCIFISFAVLAILVAGKNWRHGLTLIVLWDAVRDPIRKWLPDDIVYQGMFGTLLWCACAWGGVIRSKERWFRGFPRALWPELLLLVTYVICGFVAGIRHGQYPAVMALGTVSVVLPLVGFVVGLQLGEDATDFYKLLALFTLLNAVLIGSTFLDLAGYRAIILGGIQMEWYRMQEGYSIPLPSGLFRSPDVLGLHAALVFCFACVLFLTAEYRNRRKLWAMIGVWSGIVLMYAARRKMVGFVSIFVLALGFFAYFSNRAAPSILPHRARRRVQWILVTLLAGFVLAHYIARPQLVFAASTLNDLPSRAYSSLQSVEGTIQQSGFWGLGLGSVTQGRKYLDPRVAYAWQEDALGRIMLEVGLPGLFLSLLAVAMFSWKTGRLVLGTAGGFRSPMSHTHSLLRAEAFCIFLGYLGCGSISHLHMSGDPVQLGFLGLFGGIAWSSNTGMESC